MTTLVEAPEHRLGSRWRGTTAGWIATASIALSFAFSVCALIGLLDRATGNREVSTTLWNYAVTTGLDAKLQLLVDPLSVFMILVVSGVSTLTIVRPSSW